MNRKFLRNMRTTNQEFFKRKKKFNRGIDWMFSD